MNEFLCIFFDRLYIILCPICKQKLGNMSQQLISIILKMIDDVVNGKGDQLALHARLILFTSSFNSKDNWNYNACFMLIANYYLQNKHMINLRKNIVTPEGITHFIFTPSIGL